MYKLDEWYGVPSSCALLGGFAIGARVSLLRQHSPERKMSARASACTRSVPGFLLRDLLRGTTYRSNLVPYPHIARYEDSYSLSFILDHRTVLSLSYCKTPLSVGEATSHLQNGDVDVQGVFIIDASIPERPNPASCSCSAAAIFRRPDAVCCKNTN